MTADAAVRRPLDAVELNPAIRNEDSARIPLPGGSSTDATRARSLAAWVLMSSAERIAFGRELHGRRRLRLFRCTDLSRNTPWFATADEARGAWPGPLMDSAVFQVGAVLAVKWHAAGLEFVVDPSTPVSIDWEDA